MRTMRGTWCFLVFSGPTAATGLPFPAVAVVGWCSLWSDDAADIALRIVPGAVCCLPAGHIGGGDDTYKRQRTSVD